MLFGGEAVGSWDPHKHTYTHPTICYKFVRECSLMDPQAKLIARDDGGDGDSWRSLAHLRHARTLTGAHSGSSNRSTTASCCQDYNKFTDTHRYVSYV